MIRNFILVKVLNVDPIEKAKGVSTKYNKL